MSTTETLSRSRGLSEPSPTPESSTFEAARQIEQLASENLTEDVFFGRWLELTSNANDARAAAVWLLDSRGQLGLMADRGLEDVGLGPQSIERNANLQVVIETIRQNRSVVHQPGETGGLKLPTDHVYLLVPLLLDEHVIGVCQQFLSTDSPAEQRLEQLQFLEESAVVAARYLGWRNEAGSPDRQLEFWTRFDACVGDLHRTLHPNEVALTAANDGRQLLAADRVSVVLRRGARTDVVAVSGQDRVRKRSNVVRSLRDLAVRVMRGGQIVTYAGSLDAVPPPLESVMTAYVQESGSRMVRLIPLKTPAPLVTRGQQTGTRRPAKTFGMLVVEQTDDGWLTPLAAERADRFAEHAALALHNARTHHGVFLLPLLKAAGAVRESVRGRVVFWLLLVLCLLAGLAGAMAFIPAEYRVEGNGKLMPVHQRDVFAYWDGDIAEIYVQSGQRVAARQPLLRIQNDEWQSRLVELESQLEEKGQLLLALTEEYRAAGQRGEQAEEIRLRGKAAQTTVEIQGLKLRVAELKRQIAELTIRAPIAGTVATFQLEQLLMHRKVRRGERLLEIMDEDGPWQLELQVPEHRFGHLSAARSRDSQQPLTVDFVLATHPEAEHQGTLRQISSRVSVNPGEGAVVKAHVDVDREALAHRHIGAEVSGKIRCGQRSLFYVLFGDVVEFVQRRWW